MASVRRSPSIFKRMRAGERSAMELSAQPDVSVIVVNWNALEITTAALRSVIGGTDVEYELIVIDNGSTHDDSANELPRRFKGAVFIANPSNFGFSRAVNQGLTRATGRYLLALNNDTRVVGNAIGDTVKYMDTHLDVGALGVLHYNDDEERTKQPSSYDAPTPLSELLLVARLDTPPAPDPRVLYAERDVDWVCGSFLMIRRACLEQVGPLDEDFFAYDEDIEWCTRARRAGWKVRFWPGAALIHRGGGVRLFMRDKTFVHFRSRLTYLRKQHSPFAAIVYYVAINVALGAAAVSQALRLLIGRASIRDVRSRVERLVNFAALRPGRVGG
jgi:N-acetylglucosaminyl-diphospho-decaprenol L-rhamnosyltransferase